MSERRTIISRIHFRHKGLGFVKVRRKGSHVRFEHADGRKTTVPDHGSKDVPIGLMRKIIRHDLQMEVDDFLEQTDD